MLQVKLGQLESQVRGVCKDRLVQLAKKVRKVNQDLTASKVFKDRQDWARQVRRV